MKICFGFLVIICTVVLSFAQAKYEPGVILLKVQQPDEVSITKNQVINGSTELQVVFQQYGAINSRRIRHVGPRMKGWYRIEFPVDKSLHDIKSALKTCSDVKEVSFHNYNILSNSPNDPLWSDQWGLQLINMPDAWDITTASNDVLVGILDTGLDYTHEDLSNNIRVNPEEDYDGDGVVGDFGPP
jgi:subtilisin family serine protease